MSFVFQSYWKKCNSLIRTNFAKLNCLLVLENRKSRYIFPEDFSNSCNYIDESERVHTNPKTLIRRSATVPDVRTIRTVPLGNESTTKIDELVKKLKSSNWEQALKALKIIQEKMQTNFNEIYPFLCYISPALKTLMKNPRTSVVRLACDTVFVMFSQCPAHKLTTEVEELFPVLLTKVIDTNRFIRDIAEKALLSIPRCTTMFKLVRIVCNHGFKNVDKKSRAKISKMLFNFVQSSGSDTIFAHKREHVYELIRLISKFLTDNCPESRHYAKECLKLLAVDAKFIDYYFEKLASDLPLNVQKIFLDTIAND